MDQGWPEGNGTMGKNSLMVVTQFILVFYNLIFLQLKNVGKQHKIKSVMKELAFF